MVQLWSKVQRKDNLLHSLEKNSLFESSLNVKVTLLNMEQRPFFVLKFAPTHPEKLM